MPSREPALIHMINSDALEVNQWQEWVRPLKSPVHTYRAAEEFLAFYSQPTPGCLLIGLPDAARWLREITPELRARNSPLATMLVETYITIPDAVHAIKSGVFTILERPLERSAFVAATSDALAQSRTTWSTVHSWTNLLQSLSDREREVVDLLLNGMTTKEISKALQISSSTVHKHRIRVFSKLRVDSSTDLVLKSAHFLSRPTLSS